MNPVFIDSSGFKALLDTNDDFYLQAKKIWQEMLEKELKPFTSNYIVDECVTLLRYRASKKLCFEFKKLLEVSNILEIKRVTQADELKAWEWFERDWSKLSFTDCVCFAQLERLRITQIFGFDQHFEKAGFELLK